MVKQPRGRMLRENILDSKKLGTATHAACNLWFRLLVKVDDFGNFPDDHILIKNTCFMYTRTMKTTFVKKLVDELVGLELLSRYDVNQEHFLHFERFEDFQKMKYEKVAKFPRFELPKNTDPGCLQWTTRPSPSTTGNLDLPVVDGGASVQGLTPLESSKKGVKLSKRREVEGTAAPNPLNSWKILGSDLPMGTLRFRAKWEFFFAHKSGNPLSDAMERCILACQETSISVPKPFYDAKRRVEAGETKVLEDSKVSGVATRPSRPKVQI